MSPQISGEATIEDLPETLLVEIMRYLSMRDRCRAARVCKQWNDIFSSDSLWRHVDLLEFYIDLKTLWRLVRTRFSPRMSTLKLRGNFPLGFDKKGKTSLSDAVLKRIAALCPNLQMLQLMDCNTTKFSFESLPTSIVCLEMVNVTMKPRWMMDQQKHLPKLEHLSLDKCFWVLDSDMEDISVWTNLKYLSIRKSYFVTNEGVKSIATNLLQLEYLHICFSCILDGAVYYIVQHLKKLKQLCVAHCLGVTDNDVVLIAKGLPMLNKLDISHCPQVTMTGLKSLIGGSIRELVVVGLTKLSQKEKQALKVGFTVTRFT